MISSFPVKGVTFWLLNYCTTRILFFLLFFLWDLTSSSFFLLFIYLFIFKYSKAFSKLYTCATVSVLVRTQDISLQDKYYINFARSISKKKKKKKISRSSTSWLLTCLLFLDPLERFYVVLCSSLENLRQELSKLLLQNPNLPINIL